MWKFGGKGTRGGLTGYFPNGKLFTWGRNDKGELGVGVGTALSLSSPTQIGTDVGVNIHRSSPVQIGSDSWAYIGTGWTHTLGIKTDGTLWAWGSNSSGQLTNRDFGSL